MSSQRQTYLLVSSLPLPNQRQKLVSQGSYRLWSLGKKSSFLLPLASCLLPSLVQAQPMILAADGTGTTITPDGNRFDIRGGQVSRDGANLFHSFQRFGLDRGQIANFLSPAAIRNILTRVTGGEPSIINGLIQITGGSPNLYLMNPAGIVFGPNAQLNVPASFLATTASGIGFGDNWFHAFAANNYGTLIGTPNAFAFPNAEPAAIVNAGHLTVEPGETLTLLAGTVVSTGSIEAPGGQITLVAVPGEKVVRMSQQGHLLSLEVAPLPSESGLWTPEDRLFKPLSLPEMLTGAGVEQATGVSVNDEGLIVLTGGETVAVAPGTVVVGGTLDAATPREIPTLEMGGTIEILGDRIVLSGATLEVSGMGGGGTVKIGNDQTLGTNQFTNAEIFVSEDSTILADASVTGTGGRVTIGRWGTFLDFQGQIKARGEGMGNGGTVDIVGEGNFAGTVDLRAGNGTVGEVKLSSENITIAGPASPESQQLHIPQTTMENLTTNADVVVSAQQDITVHESLNLPAGVGQRIEFNADADGNSIGSFSMVNPQDAILTQGGDLSISGENLKLSQINTNGGAINLTGNEIHLQGGANSITSVNGEVSIAPRQADRAIEIGGAGGNRLESLSLNSAEMAAFSNGFKSIKIGRDDGSGTITVNAVQVNDSLTLASPAGTVEVQGDLVGQDDASISIQARTTALNANIETNGQTLQINSDVQLTNPVQLTTGEAGGDIQINGTINSAPHQAYNLTVNSGTGNVTFGGAIGNNPQQQLGTLMIPKAHQVQAHGKISAARIQQVSGTGDTQLSDVQTTAPEGVNITTTGNIETGAVVSQGGDIHFTSQTGQVTAERLNTSSFVANTQGGNISVQAAGSIRVGSIVAAGDLRGGAVNLTSQHGRVAVNAIDTRSLQGHQGSVHLQEAGDVEPKTPVQVQSTLYPQASSNRQISNDSYAQLLDLENFRSQEFAHQLGIQLDTAYTSGKSIQDSLKQIAKQTGKNPAIIYVVSRPEHLELVLVTAGRAPLFKRVTDANAAVLRQQVQKLIGAVSHSPDSTTANNYLNPARQLYQWLIAPLEAELQQQNIDSLAFSLDPGMRSLPLSALYDGSQFLVQKYSIGLIPSLNLTDTRYQNVQNSTILAMGASEFKDPQVVPLPAVPLELSAISQDWQSHAFLNHDFTLENLKTQRAKGEFSIVHLATHGSFDPATPSNSYIQLWDGKLHFEQLRELGKQKLELLVLSACETAFGSADAELGFAGLAVQSGVKSVLASLWQVDDAGTLGLMSEFYRQLRSQDVTVKAEALRQAQIAMIEGDLRVEGGKLRSVSRGADVPLPQTENQASVTLSHPYYWASFTMIGSLW